MTNSDFKAKLLTIPLFIENNLAALSLILLALFPTAESIARCFKTGVHGSSTYVEHQVI